MHPYGGGGKGYDYLVTAVINPDKLTLKYLRMIIHGPFKAFSDLISLVRVKDNYYIQCSELDKWPANVLFNFCIATRTPWEFPKQIEGWSTLCEAGYPEMLAFLLSHSMGGKPFKIKRQFPDSGHHWFDPASDWHNILNGTPDLTCESYHKSPTSCTPSNVIWGKSKDHEVILDLDDEKAAEHFGFVKPPPPKPRTRRTSPDKMMFDKQAYAGNWDIEAQPVGAMAAPNQAQIQQAMEHLAQFNAVQFGNAQPPQAPQPIQPWPDEVQAAPALVNIVHDPDNQPEPDFDDFPDFEDDE